MKTNSELDILSLPTLCFSRKDQNRKVDMNRLCSTIQMDTGMWEVIRSISPGRLTVLEKWKVCSLEIQSNN